MASADSEARSAIIADDEPLMRELILSMLESAGYTANAVSDASELIDAVSEIDAEIDLIIVDVSMPGMTGPEAVERIRESYPDLPVLYLSGHHPKSIEGVDLDSGVTHAIQKPFEAGDLLQAVKQVLDGPPAG